MIKQTFMENFMKFMSQKQIISVLWVAYNFILPSKHQELSCRKSVIDTCSYFEMSEKGTWECSMLTMNACAVLARVWWVDSSSMCQPSLMTVSGNTLESHCKVWKLNRAVSWDSVVLSTEHTYAKRGLSSQAGSKSCDYVMSVVSKFQVCFIILTMLWNYKTVQGISRRLPTC